jgi:hypothetical protein
METKGQDSSMVVASREAWIEEKNSQRKVKEEWVE